MFRDLCKTAFFEVCAYLSDFCVPDERDLSTGSNFNPRNISYIPVVEIFAFLELKQKLPFFKGLVSRPPNRRNAIGSLDTKFLLIF